MSGICSAHQHREDGCAQCEFRPERIVLEKTGVAQSYFDSKFPTGQVEVIPPVPSDPV